MTDLDLAALKAAAQKANNGQPWLSLDDLDSLLAEDIAQTADVRYIALANPTAVLALIERLEEALAWKRANAAQCDTLLRERDAAVSAARNCANAARARVVEIGDVLDAEDGETALEAAKRVMRKLDAATNLIAHTAARVAELAQWKESAMRVLGEHHDALQRHGTLGESTADCMDRLARQVAALVAALGHAVHRDHAPSAGCDGCLGIEAALRAAGRH